MTKSCERLMGVKIVKMVERNVFSLLILFISIYICLGRPAIAKTRGQPCPLPLTYQPSDAAMGVSNAFDFVVSGKDCDIVEAALKRYYDVIFEHQADMTLRFQRYSPGMLKSLSINLMNDCEDIPYMDMDESCEYDFTQ